MPADDAAKKAAQLEFKSLVKEAFTEWSTEQEARRTQQPPTPPATDAPKTDPAKPPKQEEVLSWAEKTFGKGTFLAEMFTGTGIFG